MRILIISDIHANLTALESVLSDAGEFDAVWCLGDLVGYGPDPNECILRVQELPNLECVTGNHDAAARNQIATATFNLEAQQAIHWTQRTLSKSNLAFLKSLPERVHLDHVTLVHGSPRQPVWEYVLDTYTATTNFEYFDTSYCFVGHTHLPVIYHLSSRFGLARLSIPKAKLQMALVARCVINPGSVGQPRDHDARAAYAIYDPDEQIWEHRRVPYDILSVQSRMKAAGLPERHIRRLTSGW